MRIMSDNDNIKLFISLFLGVLVALYFQRIVTMVDNPLCQIKFDNNCSFNCSVYSINNTSNLYQVNNTVCLNNCCNRTYETSITKQRIEGSKLQHILPISIYWDKAQNDCLLLDCHNDVSIQLASTGIYLLFCGWLTYVILSHTDSFTLNFLSVIIIIVLCSFPIAIFWLVTKLPQLYFSGKDKVLFQYLGIFILYVVFFCFYKRWKMRSKEEKNLKNKGKLLRLEYERHKSYTFYLLTAIITLSIGYTTTKHLVYGIGAIVFTIIFFYELIKMESSYNKLYSTILGSNGTKKE